MESNVFTGEHFASTDEGRSWVPIGALPGIALPCYEIGIDEEQNLVVVHYRGCVAADDVERCAQEMPAALGKTRRGFRLLVDLTAMKSMDISCAPRLQEIMKMCNEKGVAAVARIIPNPERDIGLQIMSYFHYGGDVRIITCVSRHEAMNALLQ